MYGNVFKNNILVSIDKSIFFFLWIRLSYSNSNTSFFKNSWNSLFTTKGPLRTFSGLFWELSGTFLGLKLINARTTLDSGQGNFLGIYLQGNLTHNFHEFYQSASVAIILGIYFNFKGICVLYFSTLFFR